VRLYAVCVHPPPPNEPFFVDIKCVSRCAVVLIERTPFLCFPFFSCLPFYLVFRLRLTLLPSLALFCVCVCFCRLPYWPGGTTSSTSAC
jgi:hypothetical protein